MQLFNLNQSCPQGRPQLCQSEATSTFPQLRVTVVPRFASFQPLLWRTNTCQVAVLQPSATALDAILPTAGRDEDPALGMRQCVPQVFELLRLCSSGAFNDD